MSLSLNDDLLRDFKEQKELIYKQIEILDPLGTQLRKPAAQRLVSKGILIFTEVLCYCLCAGAIAFAIVLKKVYPFYILSDLQYKSEYRQVGQTTVQHLNIYIYVIVGLVALLFLFLARSMRHLRHKNNILNFSGKMIKELVGQHLKRKAAIEAIEQRHYLAMPDMEYRDGGSIRVNDVLNPGYED